MGLKVHTFHTDLLSMMDAINLSDEVKQSSLDADVLIMPVGHKGAPFAFARCASDLYQYLCDNGVKTEILCDDENFEEIELNSKVIRLGKILVKSAVLPIALSVLANYVTDAIKTDKKDDQLVEFVSPAELNVEIEVVDSLGAKETITIEYKGYAKDFPAISAEIEKLWNEH